MRERAQRSICTGLIALTALLWGTAALATPETARTNWSGAAQACAARGKVLCVREQICEMSGDGRDGAPVDRSVGRAHSGIPKGDVWMAVGDWQNAWISIGEAYEERRCRFHEDLGAPPAWGMTSGPPTAAPAHFQCCDPASALERPAGPLPWEKAQGICEQRGMTLCTEAQLCPAGAAGAGKPPPLGSPPGDVWAAIGDRPNGWISVGQALPERLCRSHEAVAGGPPGWGTTTGPEAVTGARAALRCCPRGVPSSAPARATQDKILGARVAKVAPRIVPAPPETKTGFLKPVSGVGPHGAKWGDINELGCRSPIQRVYSARIWGIPMGASWEDACAKTSARFGALEFPTPTRCLNKGGLGGMWGEWDVPDLTCKATCGSGFCSGRGPHGERFGDRMAFQIDRWRCTSVGKSTYAAQLVDVPAGVNAMETCKATPVTVDGTPFSTPTRCKQVGLAVWGEWEYPDASCRAKATQSSGTSPSGGKFGEITAKHCALPGKRLYSSILWGLPPGTDWKTECEATSATIDGKTFARPTRCVTNTNVWGEWEVDDDRCPWWTLPAPKACSAAGLKVYHARLRDVPTTPPGKLRPQVEPLPGWDVEAICRGKPAPIGGRQRPPNRCEHLRGGEGDYIGTWGYWDEPDATCDVGQPVWGPIEPKECLWIGWRLYSAILWNIKPGASWEAVCEAMPPVAVAGEPPRRAHCVNTTQKNIDRGIQLGSVGGSEGYKTLIPKGHLGSAATLSGAVIGALIGAAFAKQWGEWAVRDPSCQHGIGEHFYLKPKPD